MNELKLMIKNLFEITNKDYTKEELRKKLNIKGEEQTAIFERALNALIEDGCLFFDSKKGYRLFSNNLDIAYGTISITKSGNAFVTTNDGANIFIKSINLNGALDGDKVIIDNILESRNHTYTGEVFKILKRKNGIIICEVINNGSNATIVPYNYLQNINFTINKNELKNLIDGELIQIKVEATPINDVYPATIQKRLGHKSDPNIDLIILAHKYEIPIEFSKETLKEVEELPTKVEEKDLQNRVDLRDKDFITIDCDTTKDRDDAIYIETLPNGNYKLYVSIADVSHYVKRGSHLFEEAMQRCTSHYPNNTCIPMFPHTLSNGICSINENVNRLTKTCELEIDLNGEIVDYQIYHSVINSRKAMKYSEVNKVLNGNLVPGYEKFISQLSNMQQLSNILEINKHQRNYLDFDIPDIEIIQDKNGKVIEFKQSYQGNAEKIIENFMIITNQTIAQNYSWFPFIYRVHESPNPEAIKSVIELLNNNGYTIPKFNNIDEKTIKYIFDEISSIDDLRIIRTEFLKAMKHACYDTNNLGHFALQLDTYCHFTSPIRRVADFMIHTIIDEIEQLDYTSTTIDNIEAELKKVSANASIAEKIAKAYEQEAQAMAMAEYMENHIGEEFEAYITQVSPYGMFIKTNEMITGKVNFEDIKDDKYYYDSKKKIIIGKHTKNQYKLGDKIYALVKEANKINGTIKFTTGYKNKRKVLTISSPKAS